MCVLDFRSFMCSICLKQFRQIDHLTDHIKDIQGKRLHPCLYRSANSISRPCFVFFGFFFSLPLFFLVSAQPLSADLCSCLRYLSICSTRVFELYLLNQTSFRIGAFTARFEAVLQMNTVMACDALKEKRLRANF